MSQEGALTMARAGAPTKDVLAQFYPGTTIGAAQATVRVTVLESASRSEVLTFPEGGQIRAVPGGNDRDAAFVLDVAPGGSVEVSGADGGYRAELVSGRGVESAEGARLPPLRLISEVRASTTATGIPTTVGPTTSTSTTTTSTTTTSTTTRPATTVIPRPPTSASDPTTPTSPPVTIPDRVPAVAGRLWAVPRADATTVVASRDRRYRGAIEIGPGPEGGLRLVNQIDVESYLRGMGEVRDPSWPPAALRAQAIAARTYALRAGGELCDDDRCQVYLGQGAEYRAMDKAVAASRGQVLLYQGALAATFYSANGGGISATAEEGFGSDGGSYPYLRSAPYATADPFPWSQRFTMADVGRRFGYPGVPTEARISRQGPSGRTLEVTLDGDGGPLPVDGHRFAAGLGLRSTLLALRPDTGDGPPPPEEPGSPPLASQALNPPDQMASLAGRAVPAVPTGPASELDGHVSLLLLLLAADLMLIRLRRTAGRALSLIPRQAQGPTRGFFSRDAKTDFAPRSTGVHRRSI